MDEGRTRPRREIRRSPRPHAGPGGPAARHALRRPALRPDRHALWALVLGISLILLTAATAEGAGGGIGNGDSGGANSARDDSATFGSRVLRVGMAGTDVRVLNGIITSKRYARAVPVSDVFETPTAAAVREFQRRSGLAPTGTVSRRDARALTRTMRSTLATWYGPGLYGNHTACGWVLRSGTIGVAHRTLPCGTKVTFAYHGRYVVAPVIDRGPFAGGRDFDLTWATRQALRFADVDRIRFAVAR